MESRKMMCAVIFESIGNAAVAKKPIPEIRKSDDVLIKVEIASICGSDLHMLSDPPSYPGKIGVINGHEMIGTVVDVGDGVTTIGVGDRVILDPNIACGKCVYCKKGMPNMCEDLLILGIFEDGVFAQYTLAPERMLVTISEEVPLERGVFAEPINCVFGAIKKICLLAGESVLVLGAGPIGLLFVQLLKANGAGKVFVSEISLERVKFARKCGITEIINPLEQNIEDEILKHTDGLGVDVVVDAVGTLLPEAIACATKGGRIVLFGQNYLKEQSICQNEITRKALTIIGNYIGDYTLQDTARLLESGLISPEILISHRLDLTDFQVALSEMRSGKAMKVALYPWGLPKS